MGHRLTRNRTPRSQFKKFDANCDGFLDLEEFHCACRELGWPMPQETLDEIYREADMDENRAIDFREFGEPAGSFSLGSHCAVFLIIR